MKTRRKAVMLVLFVVLLALFLVCTSAGFIYAGVKFAQREVPTVETAETPAKKIAYAVEEPETPTRVPVASPTNRSIVTFTVTPAVSAKPTAARTPTAVPKPKVATPTATALPGQSLALEPNGTIRQKDLAFRWSKVTGANNYYLEIDRVPATAEGFIDAWWFSASKNCTQADCKGKMPRPLTPGKYRFRILTRLGDQPGPGVWGPYKEFEVAP